MERVILSKYLVFKLNDLTRILFENEYFGFRVTAQQYVNLIYDNIYKIPDLKHYKTLNPKWGHFYVKYKPAKSKTQYFITFDKKEDKFLVKNIISNHTKEYPMFIKMEFEKPFLKTTAHKLVLFERIDNEGVAENKIIEEYENEK